MDSTFLCRHVVLFCDTLWQVNTDLVIIEERSAWSSVMVEDTPRRWNWIPSNLLLPKSSARAPAQWSSRSDSGHRGAAILDTPSPAAYHLA